MIEKIQGDIEKKIITLYLSGKSTRVVGKEIGKSMFFILTVLKRNNILRRTLSESHIGIPNNQFGLKRSKKTIQQLSNSHIGLNKGKDNGNYRGGMELARIRQRAKRESFGFGHISLNRREKNDWVGHHIDKEYVIYIPNELHKSTRHSIQKNINMNLINDEVYKWVMNYYLGVPCIQ